MFAAGIAAALAIAGLVAPPYTGNLGTGTHQGKATYTEDYRPDWDIVACPKSDHLKKLPDQFITGLNRPQFGKGPGSPNCGVIVEVTGPKGKIKVPIVDVAEGPATGSLNLDKAAFAKIADVNAGVVKISWTVAK